MKRILSLVLMLFLVVGCSTSKNSDYVLNELSPNEIMGYFESEGDVNEFNLENENQYAFYGGLDSDCSITLVTNEEGKLTRLLFARDCDKSINLLNNKNMFFSDNEFKKVIELKNNGELTYNPNDNKIGKLAVAENDGAFIIYQLEDQ